MALSNQDCPLAAECLPWCGGSGAAIRSL